MPIRRKRRSRYLTGAIITLIVILTVASLPVWMPLVAINSWLDARRRRRAARRFACLRCGKILGDEALRLSDEQHAAHYRELRKKHPGMKFRIVRIARATCTQCGALYRWDEKQRTFGLVAAKQDAAAASATKTILETENETG